MQTRAITWLAVALVAALAACGEKKTELGQGGSVVTGSAGPQGAQNAARELLRCDAPVATLALAENPNGYVMGAGYQLPASPVPLIKLLAQQSGCFRVVDRNAGLRGTIQEQDLKESGVLRQNSTLAKGKGYEAQYTLTPSLTFSEQDAGRGLAGVVAMIPVLRAAAVGQRNHRAGGRCYGIGTHHRPGRRGACVWQARRCCGRRLEQHQRGQGNCCGVSGCAQPAGGAGARPAGKSASAACAHSARYRWLKRWGPMACRFSRYRNRCSW